MIVRGSAVTDAGYLDLPPTGSGALAGVLLAVKDLFDVAGTVTGAGNPTLAAGPPAEHDAAAVAALRSAGATVVAKTATDELAMGMFGVNAHYGTPPNPAAPDRVPGGSSSGSASMVAAGDADLGLGTDTGGSVRVPAAFCGLVGLRPTHGRIDATGVRPLAAGLDTVGLLATEPDLVARAFSVLTEARRPRDVSALVVLTDLVARSCPAVADRTLDRAAAWADRLGLELRTDVLADDPALADLFAVFWPVMSRQLWQANGTWFTEQDPELGTGIADRIRQAGEVDDDALAAAETLRTALRARLDLVVGDAVAVLPTTFGPPPLRTTPHPELMAWRDRNLGLIAPASLTGAPQLTLPVGTVEDLGAAVPVGVSLLGRPGDDELLLDLACRLHASGGFGG